MAGAGRCWRCAQQLVESLRVFLEFVRATRHVHLPAAIVATLVFCAAVRIRGALSRTTGAGLLIRYIAYLRPRRRSLSAHFMGCSYVKQGTSGAVLIWTRSRFFGRAALRLRMWKTRRASWRLSALSASLLLLPA